MTLERPAGPEITRSFQRPVQPFKVPLVGATCRSESLLLKDGYDWSIWNTTLLLRHRDPTDGQVRVEHLRTGVQAEENRFAPGAYDEVRRRAILRWVDGPQTSAWPLSDGIRIIAPAVAATGTPA